LNFMSILLHGMGAIFCAYNEEENKILHVLEKNNNNK